MRTAVAGRRSARIFVASSPSIPGMRTSMITTLGRRRSATATALAPSEASPTTRICGERERERRRPSLTTSWSSAIRQVISLFGIVRLLPRHDDNRVRRRHTLEGLVVDPIDGAFRGAVVVEDGRIAAVERTPHGPPEPLLFPGFLDLHVYEPDGVRDRGVTGYLLATRRLVEPEDPLCLGLHLEGPFLNPDAAGAIPPDEITAVDLAAVEEWAGSSGLVRLVTLAPELPRALDAVERLAGAGIVAGLGHSRANALTVRAAVDAGARFATHIWNAMAPLRARSTGPVLALLLDERVTLGLIADGRHLHPDIEELTVRVAGPARIALTSDLVAFPAHR